MHCKPLSKAVTTCDFRTTVAGLGANERFLFVDTKLSAIEFTFTFAIDQVRAVREALIAKLGPPNAQQTGREGFLLEWENNVSAAAMQEHDCQNGQAMVNGPLEAWSKDISYVIEHHHCGREDALSYNYSRVIFVNKALSSLVQLRIDEAKKEIADRARKDM